MSELAVHPDADIYPMLSGDELAGLAADIKHNGLRFPIILDREGKTLIDGRNRLKACEIAGVEPRFERLNGEDPKAFIVSANLARRDLSKGQKAIALAMHYPKATPWQKDRGLGNSLVRN
jgi:ParB-like chromosome segregation protein Spo0J